MPTDRNALGRARIMLREARRIVVFTGAGVSAESGIPTFRDPNGLWTKFPPDQFANWNSILRLAIDQPALVGHFLVALLEPIVSAEPNSAHIAIAELERRGKLVTVVTQNIDRLHQRAGSQNVLEIHGSMFEIGEAHSDDATLLTVEDMRRVVDRLQRLCSQSGSVSDFINAVKPLVDLSVRGGYRPKVVLFGDPLPRKAWDAARSASGACDCMVIVGTSRLVYPAAILPDVAKAAGARTIGIGFEPFSCDEWLPGHAGSLLPRLVPDIAIEDSA
jgi:NAD-dependent deacetylase